MSSSYIHRKKLRDFKFGNALVTDWYYIGKTMGNQQKLQHWIKRYTFQPW